jgi:hypothetical protein
MGGETISTSGEPGTEEAEAFVTALNHSAERVQTLWFSFLTFMLYLAVATGTTTHRMLFLEEPLNLPVLNIKLPLLGFYILTPVIFVVLHGAWLNGAHLHGASFVDICVWRADARQVRQADWRDTNVTRPQTDPKAHEIKCDWTVASFAALKQLIAEKVPEGKNKVRAMERIEHLLDPTKPLKGEDEMAKVWAARERESPTPEAYEKSLAGQWYEVGCAAEGAPYVLHGLIAQLDDPLTSSIRDRSDAAKSLAKDIQAHCAGAHGLSEEDNAKLKEIRDGAAPVPLPMPKP